MTQIKLHFLFKITSKVIHSFEPIVTFYSFPKQRLVTLSEDESSSHDLKHCMEKSLIWHATSLWKEGLLPSLSFLSRLRLTFFFQNCFFTNPIFIISLFAGFSYDLWYVSSIYYFHYIRIYLLVMFNMLCILQVLLFFLKLPLFLSLLIVISKQQPQHVFLNKALYVK